MDDNAHVPETTTEVAALIKDARSNAYRYRFASATPLDDACGGEYLRFCQNDRFAFNIVYLTEQIEVYDMQNGVKRCVNERQQLDY